MISLSRGELAEYLEYAGRLGVDLEYALKDLRFRASHGVIHYAVDFSEIYAYLNDDDLDSKWLWQGADAARIKDIEQCALKILFRSSTRPLLLPSYAVEFHTHLREIAADYQDDLLLRVPAALDALDSLAKEPDVAAFLELSKQLQNEARALSSEETNLVIDFFAKRGATVLEVTRRIKTDPLARARALLQRKTFRGLHALGQVAVRGDSPVILDRARRLRARRKSGKAGATIVDALALETLKQLNELLATRRPSERVVIVTRSDSLADVIDKEVTQGLWPHGSPVRHPRYFVPLRWHADRDLTDQITQLESMRTSLEIFRLSAEVRLKSRWDRLEATGKFDKPLVSEVHSTKERILEWTAMAALAPTADADDTEPPPAGASAEEAWTLLTLLKGPQALLAAVAKGMRDIGTAVDRGHESLGLFLQSVDESSLRAMRTSLRLDQVRGGVTHLPPRFGRLSIGLRFASPFIRGWVERITQKSGITPSVLHQFLAEAATSQATHYEVLLVMAQVLATMGRWEIASQFVRRARLSSVAQGTPQTEALLLHALLLRRTSETPEGLAEALEAVHAARHSITGPLDDRMLDCRFASEEGSIKLTWYLNTIEPDGRAWDSTTAPTLGEAIDSLEEARQLALDEPAQRVVIENNICFGYLRTFELAGDETMKAAAEESLSQLLSTLNALDRDPRHWPVRIAETVARGYWRLMTTAWSDGDLKNLIGALTEGMDREDAAVDRRLLIESLEQLRKALKPSLRKARKKERPNARL